MMSCRGVAKIGQLMLNQGQWPDGRGGTEQLLAPGFVQQMLRSSFPQVAAPSHTATAMASHCPCAGEPFVRAAHVAESRSS